MLCIDRANGVDGTIYLSFPFRLQTDQRRLRDSYRYHTLQLPTSEESPVEDAVRHLAATHGSLLQ